MLPSILSCHQIDRIARWEVGIIDLAGDALLSTPKDVITIDQIELSDLEETSEEDEASIVEDGGDASSAATSGIETVADVAQEEMSVNAGKTGSVKFGW